MSWTEEALEVIAKCELGKMLDKRKNKGEYQPYLSNVDVRWGAFDLESLKEMRFESKEFERYSLKDGDIIMCEGGEAGRCAIWKAAKTKMMYQKALHRIRVKDNIDSSYLFYQFLNMGNKREFEPYYTGSTIKHLPLQVLKKIPVSFPILQTQKRIADILSAYDDLIENNLKRIKLLEQAAQNIYKEWFVHMRFPGHEDAVMDEETGLPEGWEEVVMEDIMNVSGGGTPSTKEPLYWIEGKVLWFSPTDLNKNSSLVLIDSTKKITQLGLKKSSAKLLSKRTILMSSRATIGLFGLYNGECSTNQGFININPKEESLRFYILSQVS